MKPNPCYPYHRDEITGLSSAIHPQYGVWCSVWGGVTGSRESWLKSNGKVMLFDSAIEAASEADSLNDKRRNHPTASFHYKARAYTG